MLKELNIPVLVIICLGGGGAQLLSAFSFTNASGITKLAVVTGFEW